MQAHQPKGSDAEANTADTLYRAAVVHVITSQRASISSLQRKLLIGYNRACRMIEQLEHDGIVSGMNSDGVRSVLKLEVPDVL